MAWSTISSPVSGSAISISAFGQKIIDNAQYLYDQLITGVAFTSYAPTWGSAVTVGNGTATGSYLTLGKLVVFRAKFVLGSTSSIGSNPATVTLPVTAASSTPYVLATARFYDTSATKWYLAGVSSTTTVASLYQVNTSGLNNRYDSISSTAPFTWATGDELDIFAAYEAA